MNQGKPPVTESPDILYYGQDITLPELLKVVERERLEALLQSIAGPQARVVTESGQCVLGPAQAVPGSARAVIRHEAETVGHVEAVSAEQAGMAAGVMEIIALLTARYYMAAAVQMEADKIAYQDMQERNAALTVSEQKYRELAASLEQRVQEQVKTIEGTHRRLYEAEKLASIGQLAAGVAHEINNPIGFIKSNLGTATAYIGKLTRLGELIRAGADPAALAACWQREQMDVVLEDFPVLLKESVDGAERVARIVSELKDFSDIDRAGQQAIDVGELVRSVCHVVAHGRGEQVVLDLALTPVPAVFGDPGHLRQALMNVVLNAFQAMPGHGTLRAATRLEADAVWILISDDGAGMSDVVLARVFEPFFTTREVGRGTGLGLTVARDVVKAHGGDIDIESRPGAGTTVILKLPAHRE